MKTVPEFTLKQLAYLRALVHAGSFGAASGAANISQPALSLQIQALETHFGGKLVERRRAGLKLTPLGALVLERANDILTRADDLSTLAVQAHDVPAGPLRFGLIPTVAPYLLPRILPDLRHVFPDLAFAIREGKTTTLVADLEANAIDVAVMALPLGQSWLQAETLLEETFVLAVGPGFSPPKGKAIRTSDLSGKDVLLLEEGHCLRDQTIQACGINVNRALNRFGATSLSTIIEMVANDYGVTLLPEMSLEKEAANKRIKLYPLKEPCPTRQLGLVWRSSSPYSDFYNRMAVAITPGK